MIDATAFRDGVGGLLAEVQRIKAEGDYPAAQDAVRDLRHPLRRDAARRGGRAGRHLNMPSYTGFVQPKLEPVTGPDGAIADVRISYPMDLKAQMLEYSGRQ